MLKILYNKNNKMENKIMSEQEKFESEIKDEIENESSDNNNISEGNTKKPLFDRFGDGLDNIIKKMDKYESRMMERLDNLGLKMESFLKESFSQILIKKGFNPNLIDGLFSRFKNINPIVLARMNRTFGRVKDDNSKDKGEEKDINE